LISDVFETTFACFLCSADSGVLVASLLRFDPVKWHNTHLLAEELGLGNDRHEVDVDAFEQRAHTAPLILLKRIEVGRVVV